MKKKIIFGIIIAVIFVWIAASWFTGTKIEPVVKNADQEIRSILMKQAVNPSGEIIEAPSQELQLTLENYQRGVFSSVAEYRLMMSGILLPVKVTIDHGPFPLLSLMKGDISPKLIALNIQFPDTPIIDTLKSITNHSHPLQIQTEIHFNGQIDFSLRLAPVDSTMLSSHVLLRGLNINASLQPNADARGNILLTFNSKLDEFLFDSPNRTIHFSGVKLTGDYRQSLDQLSAYADESITNSQYLEIKKINLAGSASLDNRSIALTNLRINLTQTYDEHYLDLLSSLMIGDFVADDMPLGSGSLQLDLTHLNKSVLLALIKHPDLSDNRTLWLNLLGDDPIISLSPLVWKNTEGQAHLAARLQLADPAKKLPEVVHPDALHYIDHFDGELTVAKPMMTLLIQQVKRLADQSSPLTSILSNLDDTTLVAGQPMFTIHGDELKSKITLDKGLLQINDQQITLTTFIRWFNDNNAH